MSGGGCAQGAHVHSPRASSNVALWPGNRRTPRLTKGVLRGSPIEQHRERGARGRPRAPLPQRETDRRRRDRRLADGSPGRARARTYWVDPYTRTFWGGDPDARGGVESASASRASTRKSKLFALRQTLVSSVVRELPHEERPAKLPPLGTGVGAPVRALSRRSREGAVVRRHPWTGAIRGPAPSVVRHHPGCARTRRPAARMSLERSRGPRHRLAARSRRHHRVVRRRAERSAWARRRARAIWPAASSDEEGACGGAVRS